MYSACLFCNSALGQNESLEHFPVGRRLAYHAEKGRLWVICAKCERWNLTPLETRWEAIEEAERAYRTAALKMSTDNIGLAQLRDGLELVRIGAPPKTELAAWRYGDQFGRRHRRHVALSVLTAGGAVAPLVINLARLNASTLAAGLVGVGTVLSLGYSFSTMWRVRRAQNPLVVVRDQNDEPLRLTGLDVRRTALIPGRDQDWQLQVRHRVGFRDSRAQKGTTVQREAVSILTGTQARRALATMLPHLNQDGGSQRRVRDAMEVIAAAPTLDALLRSASIDTEARGTHYKLPAKKSIVSVLPGHVRLALEMALHEDDEQRAMEGQMKELEQRWRDADVIASIADSLTLPAGIEEQMDALRRSAAANPGQGGPIKGYGPEGS